MNNLSMDEEEALAPRASFKKDLALIGILLAICIVCMFLNFWYITIKDKHDKHFISLAGELRVLSQAIAKDSSNALDGSYDSFASLLTHRDEFDHYINILKRGDEKLAVPSSAPDILSNELVNLEENWRILKLKVDSILGRQDLLVSLREMVVALSNMIPKLQLEYSALVEKMLSQDAPSKQVAAAIQQTVLAERILRNIDGVLQGGEESVLAANQFARNTNLFSIRLESMRSGNVALDMPAITDPKFNNNLAQITELFSYIKGSIEQVGVASNELVQVTQAGHGIYSGSQKLLDNATRLMKAYMIAAETRLIGEPTGYMLGATGILLFIWLSYRAHENAQAALVETRIQHRANREAIWRLLEELANLADGDLTVHATVGDEMTGAIAESVNYAIDALRKLALTINQTAVQVSTSAQQAQSTARRLAEASEEQAREIVGVSAAIHATAGSIEQVSTNAAESSKVAQDSVSTAKTGVNVVQDTMDGMERIKEQMQDTAKQIKRLGESTQEIVEIVSLINDITEQTNILALNASIQAAMAGEAGKGFAVVAEEVQRLAERSSQATKKIEAIVGIIQNDTTETVKSMQQTTQEVIAGAHLAQDAGSALEKIETVSLHLAQLIHNISTAAHQHADTAVKISKTMGVIQEIATQTALGTTETANSIGELAELAVELRHSVAGFKLPTVQQQHKTLLSKRVS